MKVAVFPNLSAVFFTAYLNLIALSALRVSRSNLMPISFCPAAPTSWWCSSGWIPTARSIWEIFERRLKVASIGGAAK